MFTPTKLFWGKTYLTIILTYGIVKNNKLFQIELLGLQKSRLKGTFLSSFIHKAYLQ